MRGLRSVTCCVADVPGLLLRPRPAVSPSTKRRRREDLQVVGVAAVRASARLDVGVERRAASGSAECGEKIASELRRREARGPASLSPACRMTGWPCGLRGTVKRPVDVELRAAVRERPGVGRRRTNSPGVLVGDDLVVGPRVPQLADGRDELLGALVALGVVEEAAAAEVLRR